MKSRANFRLMAFVVLVVLLLALAAQNSLAQATVSVSPVALSFAIPTGTPTPLVFTLPVTVNIIGTGTATLSDFAVTPITAPTGDFIVNGNSCMTPQTAPTTCQIGVQFTSTQAAGTLETATLSFNSSTQVNPISVPLSGAYGAIKLFDETNVTATPSSAPFTPYTIASKTLNLTCPASPTPVTATLSGTPDGSGYVLVDNYITLATGPSLTPVTDPLSTDNPAGNVCTGSESVADDGPGGYYADCFTSNYQEYAYGLTLPPPVGLDPDTFANPGNTVLSQIRPNTNNAGGVPYIDIHSFLAGSPTGTYPEQALFTLLSSGNEEVYDNSTLFLVTNCSAPGIIPGTRVTLNPISTSNPASETQTATLDSSPGQKVSFTTSVAVALQNNSGIITNGIVPIVTDYPVPQQLFSQLVSGTTGTSAAPAVCVRLAGELDAYGQPMCKGFLLQCYNPADGTTTGDNCSNPTSEISDRYLFYNAQFNSPDAPSGYNFLTTQSWAADNAYTLGQTIVDPGGYVQQVTTPGTSGGTAPTFNETVATTPGTGQTDDGTGSLVWTNEGPNACANVATWDESPSTPIACAPGTGPGMLMGSDYWLGNPPLLTVSTETTGSTYNSADCVFTTTLPGGGAGGLAGALCPLDVLTAILGAADESNPGTGKYTNSLFIPVVNMPLPTATATFAAGWSNGWINNLSTAMVNFNSTAAGYSGTASNPPANGFSATTAAAPYSLTYGVSPSPTLPDTTYPVTGDIANHNSFTQANTPFCNISGATPSPFASATSPSYFSTLSLSEGQLYNLHYFTTDCAFTEGLVFSPTPQQVTDPTANWASFPYLTFGVDTTAPTLSSCSTTPSPYPGGGGWYNSNVTIACTGNDSESGFAPGTAIANTNGMVLEGSATTTLSQTTTCSGTCPAATIGPLQATDLAGNQSTTYPVSGAASFPVDLQAPSITLPVLSSASGPPYYVNGPSITVTFGCSDAGSGVASGGCAIVGSPAGYTPSVPPCTGVPASVTCTGTISNTSVVSGNLIVTATDNVSNNATSASSPVSYAVISQNTPTITFVTVPSPTYLGGIFTVGATTNSDGALSYSYVSGPCSLVSATLGTFSSSGGGVCKVQASTLATVDYVAGSATQNVTIGQATPNLAFGPAPTPTYLGPNFTVSATTNSNGALSYSYVSGPCAQVSGGTFSSSGGGTCVVQASTLATANFIAASTQQSVTIGQATPTITFGTAPSPTYPGNFTVTLTANNSNGALTFSASGPCSFTPVSTTATTATFSSSGGGLCVVQASTLATTNFKAGLATQNVTISAPLTLTITPSSWNFSPTPFYLGQNAQQVFTLTNPGTSSIAISSISIPESNIENPQPPGDPDDFKITRNTCGKTLGTGANNSCQVTVTFISDSDDPPLNGGNYAYLTVADNATGSPQTAKMYGTVIDPDVTLSSNSLNFGTVKHGTTSATLKVTLTNINYGKALELSGLTITPTANFALVSGAGTVCTGSTTLAANGGTCNIYVTFEPTKANTTYSGSVTITNQLLGGKQTITLMGRGD
ncbi:MAG: choice-of-anchor D domain-containing protein [Terriglobales bacterium]